MSQEIGLFHNAFHEEHVQLRFGVKKSPVFSEQWPRMKQTWQHCR